MTYANNAELGNTASHFFYVLNPRKEMGSWTLVTGTTYRQLFEPLYITGVIVNGTSLVLDLTLSADNTYTLEGGYLYIRTSLTISYSIVSYKLYVSTLDISTYSTPTDDSTDIVNWDGIVLSSPSVSASVDLANVGIVSTSTSGLTLANVNGLLDTHLHSVSLNRTPILIYHALGDPTDDANCALVFTGFCSDVSASETTIDLSIQDASASFDNRFTYANGNQMYLRSTVFPDLDPRRINDPMPIYLGRMTGNEPVNISYSTTIDTSHNRTHLCFGWDGSFKQGIFFPVTGSPTTTVTYFTPIYSDRITFTTSDYAILCRANGSRVHIVVTSAGSGYIGHSSIGTPAAVGDYVLRIPMNVDHKPQLSLVQNGLSFGAFTYLTHWQFDVVHTGSIRYVKLILTSGAEAGIGASPFNPETDYLSLRMEGFQTDKYVADMPNITDVSTSDLWPTSQRAEIQLKAILEAAGLPVSTNWTWWRGRPSSLIYEDTARNFYPRSIGEGLPSLREIITEYLFYLSAFLYYDTEGGGWNYRQLKKLSDVDVEHTITDDDISVGSYHYSYEMTDLYTSMRLFWGKLNSSISTLKNEYQNLGSEYLENLKPFYMHNISRDLSIESIGTTYYVLNLGYVQQYRMGRVLSIFSQPQGRLSIEVTNVYQTMKIGDVVKVTLKAMAGCEYNEDGNSRYFRVESITRNQNKVQLVLNDQQGIQQDTDNWPTVQVP